MRRAITVLATGPQTLIQDLGRPGSAHLGVPPSGALDGPALRLANRLAGNPEHLAGIEALLGGLRIRAESSCTVAVTGPAVPVTVDGRAVGSHAPVHLRPGAELEIGAPATGLRCYLGISGGVEVPAELGSRATDTLSGIGPEPLRPGDVLPLGNPAGPPTGADELAPVRAPDRLTVPVLLGPRADWFDDPGAQLAGGEWTVSPQSNRVGVRLVGLPLRRAARYAETELPSEGVVTGAVQVPAGGRPVIFLADHPTTGGYPVIGVVRPDALPALGQARPGTAILFRPAGQYSDS
ncbi:MAG TPA: biotin-dependent carboxyltransferase family protein [Actinophytocola sp.]|uniref:5-oxoprolinase subunit C family protein n=1 Tax=Actinophytocola sp. TaxID=1872138 RepID=UPI002DB8605C|nr:biotin-dependent carboxyltransferase family protein [Actinophytocola sp.]HEU5474122.1 biotin-dependent carboxyltransferase family protein [Actinophytocola sp.]